MKVNVTYPELEQVKRERSILLVDVRSPREYQQATIPGAVNLPVLNDEERREVGTLYVSGKVEEAKRYGVNAISPRLPAMFQQYQEYLRQYDQVVVFCSRGGFRSNSIFSLLKALGMRVSRLEGGYKGYRRTVHEALPKLLSQARFVTLSGNTGSGKTAILNELQNLGANVLNLEKHANHRGSLLGSVGLGQPHSQKMFESLLYEAAQEWKAPYLVFTEGESKRIGDAILPPYLVEAMQAGTDVLIEADLSYRMQQIKQDYFAHGDADVPDILKGLDGLKRYLNEERVEGYKRHVAAGQLDPVIEDLLLKYYDPRYNLRARNIAATFRNDNPAETARALLQWATAEVLSQEPVRGSSAEK